MYILNRFFFFQRILFLTVERQRTQFLQQRKKHKYSVPKKKKKIHKRRENNENKLMDDIFGPPSSSSSNTNHQQQTFIPPPKTTSTTTSFIDPFDPFDFGPPKAAPHPQPPINNQNDDDDDDPFGEEATTASVVPQNQNERPIAQVLEEDPFGEEAFSNHSPPAPIQPIVEPHGQHDAFGDEISNIAEPPAPQQEHHQDDPFGDEAVAVVVENISQHQQPIFVEDEFGEEAANNNNITTIAEQQQQSAQVVSFENASPQQQEDEDPFGEEATPITVQPEQAIFQQQTNNFINTAQEDHDSFGEEAAQVTNHLETQAIDDDEFGEEAAPEQNIIIVTSQQQPQLDLDHQDKKDYDEDDPFGEETVAITHHQQNVQEDPFGEEEATPVTANPPTYVENYENQDDFGEAAVQQPRKTIHTNNFTDFQSPDQLKLQALAEIDRWFGNKNIHHAAALQQELVLDQSKSDRQEFLRMKRREKLLKGNNDGSARFSLRSALTSKVASIVAATHRGAIVGTVQDIVEHEKRSAGRVQNVLPISMFVSSSQKTKNGSSNSGMINMDTFVKALCF
jgi:hypothetical protein